MTALILSSLAILGAICASFVGVVAERAYTGQSWKRGRSRCNSCRQSLGARDLLPAVSWFAYRGRCRMCRSKVPVRYAVSEIALAALFVLSYLHLGLGLPLVLFLSFLCVLSFVVIYDLHHHIVPLPASALLILIALAYMLTTASTIAHLEFTLLVAALVALFFFSLYFFSRGRAMGLGDTPVAFALSLLSGSTAIAGLFFSFWVGAVIGIAILVSRPGGPRMGIEVPFVPFLAIGFLLAFFTQWNPLPF
ncbi:MAG: prepilin peptidase [Patescibacteria group bacterium]